MANKKQLKIGLVLGSGWIKGLAHIGVIKILPLIKKFLYDKSKNYCLEY